MYIETSSPRRPGDVARLISSGFLPRFTRVCLRFWYHMYGSSIGTLTVFAVRGNITTTLFVLSGNRGNQWFEARVNVPSFSSNYKVKNNNILMYQGNQLYLRGFDHPTEFFFLHRVIA